MTFNPTLAARLAAELAKADEMATAKPWQYGQLEFGGRMIRDGSGYVFAQCDDDGNGRCAATLRNLALSASQQLAGACEEAERQIKYKDEALKTAATWNAEAGTLYKRRNELEDENARLAARVAEPEGAVKEARCVGDRAIDVALEQHLAHEKALRSQLASVKRARDELADMASELDGMVAPEFAARERIAELRRVGGSDE